MQSSRYIFYILTLVAVLMAGCSGTGKGTDNGRAAQTGDTIYTAQAAMSIYGYQPERALQIVDSAVIVGNLSEVRADICRARIYGMTQMYDQLDSLLGGPKDIHLDSAQALGERLLMHDSVKADLLMRQDVLETLVYTERMQQDTIGWMQRLRELANVCHQQGAETDALRTEAEIGAALISMGQQDLGMAKLDSVIDVLSNRQQFKYNELDALIIALKRKIVQIGSKDRYAETVPLARRIIERLDDYEAHPDAYHDGSHREPKNDQKRADYIRFYRGQAQNFIVAAYSSLGESGNMLESFRQIEASVRDVTAREHIARYNALQQQMEAERQQANANRANLLAIIVGILALLFLAFAVVVIFINRTISRKNRLMAQQITETVNYKRKYWDEKRAQTPTPTVDLATVSDEQLFKYINEVIVRDRLFLDPKFGRQTIIDRFQLSKERVGAIFSKGSEHNNLTSYVQLLRLECAAHQLMEQPDKNFAQIAADCGFSSSTYFSNRFRQHFGMSPTDFRKEALASPTSHSSS